MAHNAAFKKWPDELPKDLQITLPQNGGVPSLASHFVGNMHSHYHLAIVMLHRPQLKASESFGADSQWRHHMTTCYRSAKVLCRIQEAVLAQYDLTGLLCMQRGINFTIYAILTCIMLHLVALSSPDPEFNSEAKDYFVRHMRILERCVAAWPMPETEAQINSLRAAFSADVTKPFELKESFPLGSPSDQSRPSPMSQTSSERQQQQQQPQQQQQQSAHQLVTADLQQPQPNYFPPHMNQMRGPTNYLATPPVSSYSSDSKPQTPIYPQTFELEQTQYPGMPTSAGGYYHQPTSAPDIQWNPTPIIDQFDTAFAIPSSQLAPPPSMFGGSGSSPPGNMQNLQASFTSTNSPTYGVNTQGYPQQPQYFSAHSQSFPDLSSPVAGHRTQLPSSSSTAYPTSGVGGGMFVTSRQWQQSVANVMDTGGLKRRWDYEQH